MITVLDTFSGIGAFTLAAHHIGARVVAHVEKDKHCNQLLAKHHPNSAQLGDIYNVQESHIAEPIKLLCGGSPCQNFSVAGNGEGLAGEESQLWFEYLRLVKALKPEWLVWENVPNALYTNGGFDFFQILRGLDDCGYHVAWRVLDAQYFGVPQRRRRIFLVGNLRDGRAAEVLFERESLPGTSKTRPRAWKSSPVAGTMSASASGTARPAGQGNELDFLVFGRQHSHTFNQNPDTASTLAARDYKDFGDLVSFAPSAYKRGFGSELRAADVANSLQANIGSGWSDTDEHIITFTPASYKRDIEKNYLSPKDYAATLRRNLNKNGDSSEQLIQHGMIRRFTPLECERLQGFPDGYTEGFSDSTRYSMLGNSIAVPVAKWVFERIAAVGND